ncbi:hypothetical protein [Microtetraspora malaysiensis]|uniref:hypothetical protein n=1 Tax=Microtetraspora malaysiensis TaxID=161358 RepID=UPI000836845D|nr:hypothetical protein [Microtetraspora malaysiensis]
MDVYLTQGRAVLFLAPLAIALLTLPFVSRQYRGFGQIGGWSGVVAMLVVLYGCGVVAFTLFPLPKVTPGFCVARVALATPKLQLFGSFADIARENVGAGLFTTLGDGATPGLAAVRLAVAGDGTSGSEPAHGTALVAGAAPGGYASRLRRTVRICRTGPFGTAGRALPVDRDVDRHPRVPPADDRAATRGDAASPVNRPSRSRSPARSVR